MGLFDIARRVFTGTNNQTPDAISNAYEAQGMDSGTYLGPGRPLTPVRGFSGQPRAMDYPTAVNIGYKNRQQWGRTSYEVLRELLRSYDIATICKNHKIDELRSMEPLFNAKEGFTGDADAAIVAARKALEFPDRENPWDQWLSMWMENILTFDAGPLFRRRNYAGEVIGLEVLDGSTIYPLIDEHGRRPKAPAEAYQQIIKGEVSQLFTAEDLVFTRFRSQTDSPYGMAPLESIVVNMSTDLKAQWHFLQLFTEGSIPGGFGEAPPDVSSPDQVAEWQDYWDSMFMGDQSILHKLIIVPNGMKVTETAPKTFDRAFPEWLAMKTAMSFGVVPQDLGFTSDVNRANGETQSDIQFRVNTLPWVRFVERWMSRYLQRDLGLPVEFRLNTGREKEDRLADANAWKIYIESGIASPDEAREELLGLPVDNVRPIPRGFVNPRQGWVPFDQLLAVAGKTDPETKAPAADAVLPDAPFDGTPGLMPDKLPGEPAFHRAQPNPDDPEHPAVEHPSGSNVVNPPAPEPAAKEATVGLTSATGDAGVDMVGRKVKKEAIMVAGLAVVADDTGRVLMIQRGLEPGDPAAGKWEFPGGHLEDGETPFDGAAREWSEETGLTLPAVHQIVQWDNGIYRLHVAVIPREADLPINPDSPDVINPDDPDGDVTETVAWWEVPDLDGNPVVRSEVQATPWAMIDGASPSSLDSLRKDELAKFAAFTKARKRSGKWRDFEFVHHEPHEAQALNKAARDGGEQPDPKGWRADPPNPTPFHTVDLALTDHWTPLVAAALAGAVDTDTLADEAIDADWTAAEAADWASDVFDTSRLAAVVGAAHADGYLAGALSAGVQTGTPGLLDGFHPGIGIEFRTPEDAPLPVLDALSGTAWQDALAEANITVKGITDTTLQRMGVLIERAVEAGHTVDRLARDLNAYLSDPSRAEMIAHTETARMATNASLAVYRAYGLTQWDWIISAGACPICTDEASRNPHRMGDDQPPGHPRCRCAASPHTENI